MGISYHERVPRGANLSGNEFIWFRFSLEYVFINFLYQGECEGLKLEGGVWGGVSPPGFPNLSGNEFMWFRFTLECVFIISLSRGM